MSETPNLLLFYWVCSTPFDEWRSVEVAPATTIETLKTLVIQKSPELSKCNRIVIYKVPPGQRILCHEPYHLGDLSMSMLGEPLRNTQNLSGVFTSPPKDQLHLIIDGLDLSVSYWLRGSTPGNPTVVDVPSAGKVQHLKKIIKDEEHDFGGIPRSRLRLYKISRDDNELVEILNAIGVGEMMNETRLVRDVFNDIPFNVVPRVVVEWLDERPMNPPPTTYRHIGKGGMVKAARAEFLQGSAAATPSGAAQPLSFRTRQGNEKKCIPCGRPRANDATISPMLLHRIFGEFVDDCDTINYTPADYCFASDLADVMSVLYENEAARRAAVGDKFRQYGIHFNTSKVRNTKYEADADLSTNGNHYVIAEFKNEVASSPAEPYFQALLYYLESTRDTALKFPGSPLPCFLLSIQGPYLVFAGATWNLRPCAQMLSSPLGLFFHSRDRGNLLKTARYLAAFRKAIQNLKEYYERQLAAEDPGPDILFPHPTTCTFQDREIEIDYKMQQDEHKLIFFGTVHDRDHAVPVCIKFVQTYSPDAHRYFASLGCAPALHSLQRLPGGCMMVVMDRLSDDFETLANRTSALPGSVFDDIAAKLEKFHAAGYVHGDIRDANIMVSKSDETRFMFVDFDWAGRNGEAWYPDRVNYQDIRRPEDVRIGHTILPDHDLFMLDRLTRTRSGSN